MGKEAMFFKEMFKKKREKINNKYNIIILDTEFQNFTVEI